MRGTVKWFDAKKGIGFISREHENDLFVHYSQIQSDGFRTLKEGNEVEFDVVPDSAGRHQAGNVRVVDSQDAVVRGTVKWFSSEKGHGFITREDGGDLFVHYSQIQMDGFRVLHEGDEVEFEVIPGRNNKFQAGNVRKV